MKYLFAYYLNKDGSLDTYSYSFYIFDETNISEAIILQNDKDTRRIKSEVTRAYVCELLGEKNVRHAEKYLALNQQKICFATYVIRNYWNGINGRGYLDEEKIDSAGNKYFGYGRVLNCYHKYLKLTEGL